MNEDNRYRFEQLVSSKAQSFDQMYRIYQGSIPVSEQKQKMLLAEMLNNPEYKIFLLKTGDKVVGFSILYCPENEYFCLLEYMAIDDSYRSLGLGKKLFLKTFEDKVSDGALTVGLLEVDSDRVHSTEQANNIRRQKFYKRLGCLRIEGLSYVMPSVGGGVPPQMDILVYFQGQTPIISKQQLSQWLKVIYSKVYGCDPNDNKISLMIERLDDPIKLV